MRPVNNHLLIQPVSHETFVATAKDVYEEIGVVLDYDRGINTFTGVEEVSVGDRVYFDSWLAAKYPAEKEGEFYWLVEWQHVRAVDNAPHSLPK